MVADILLVEDDPTHAELVTRGFESIPADVQIRHVTDGEAALVHLQAALRAASLPDVVLLDLRLPRMGGLDLLESLKQHPELRRVPVVILTSSNASSDVRAAYDRHANSYLVKPLDLASLTNLLADLAHYWGECNRPPQRESAF
ncbi:MAG: response regulator [Myxococcales bacterium]|nr:response regulator [Myxococcales bacterium]